jgi:hypothetical protein
MAKKEMIWLDGERELFLNMQRNIEGTTKASRLALERAGLNIIADAKENLRENGSIAQGHLRASGRVQRVEGDPDALDVGFTEPYAYFVEYGRRSGRMPPVADIIGWLKKKTSTRKGIKNAFESAAAHEGMSADRYLRSLAFLIARAIGKKGTRPHPFFAPAVEKNKKQVNEAIEMAIKQEIK